MRDAVYFLVFDGFADWQTALALYEIRRPCDWRVRVVAQSMTPVQSASGLRVTPDETLDALEPARAALAILPGGHSWERGRLDYVAAAAQRIHDAGGTVAASGTAMLAMAHLAGKERYFCASEHGSVEFARGVIAALDLYDPSDREDWYRLFKHGTPAIA
ncbi:DJ-1/PfpI family protein [Luteibacter rhizovicinus]|uniref:DJ-1/PfpI family protein n=1 Tax=Luteibacter rhizovicinus TaxID=242606 RepID=A0A4V2W3V1_9GAMM|nr:DJ-1/PfpI family protein [Luteibacter rhizovicinus]TCV92909.1 DJ-1/PfpI family protein [Luteibacter rhizovicinus]